MSVDPAYLQTAIEIALRAGDMQIARQGGDLQVGKKGVIDLVTQVDVDVETLGRSILSERFPTHTVLAEELPSAPADRDTDTRYCWIFDPIDGTVNYAHGIPIFCTSLALEIDGQVEVGVVYDPSRRELFVAERGEGARLNGAPLQVSTSTDLIDALLCTGFPYDVHTHVDEVVRLFGKFVRRARAVRRLGSAALDLCYVAAGRFDGFWERGLQAWDSAAAALIVEEAGGRVTGMDGQVFASRDGHIVASNGPLHDIMLSVIREFDAGRARNRTD